MLLSNAAAAQYRATLHQLEVEEKSQGTLPATRFAIKANIHQELAQPKLQVVMPPTCR